ncbi:uncharacterized protein HaLaN_23942, partial [Haematococcus lacustris]
MPPKKKGGAKKKKKDDGAEPPHEPSWERTVETGLWERPATDLPDANMWPTWGALRERVLTACKEVQQPGLRVGAECQPAHTAAVQVPSTDQGA